MIYKSEGACEYLNLVPDHLPQLILQERQAVRGVVMRNLTRTGIGIQFAHETPVLAATLIGGGVLEKEPLLDSVRRKLNTGLLV